MAFQEFTPEEYLRIDVASNFGLDKRPWKERLDWFADHLTEIVELSWLANAKAISSHPLMKAAKEPALFFAGIRAWGKTQRGEPTGYPISLDATASGAQILSLLIDCEQSGSLCNLVDTGERENLYANLYQFMLPLLNATGDISEDQVKKAIMTSFFGSKRQPRKLFGEGDDLDVFYQVMSGEAPGAWSLNEALIDLWQPGTLSHDWVLPDNFHVKVKVMTPVNHKFLLEDQEHTVTTYHNIGTDTGLSLAANITHSVDGLIFRELGRRCSYDTTSVERLRALLKEIDSTGTYSTSGGRSPHHELAETLWRHYLESGFLSARILEHLDSENLHLVDIQVIRELVETLPRKPFPVLGVHDCFRVHANYGNDLRRQYNRILSDMAASDLLAFIVKRIAGPLIVVSKFGGNLAPKILEANYALS